MSNAYAFYEFTVQHKSDVERPFWVDPRKMAGVSASGGTYSVSGVAIAEKVASGWQYYFEDGTLDATVVPEPNSTDALTWLPPEVSAPEEGKSYAPIFTGGVWSGWAEVPATPSLDTFIDGWQFFPWSDVVEIIQSGSLHVAAQAGSLAPATVGTVSFETAGGTGNTNVPGAGFSGTNWLIEDASEAPVPPVQGNNAAQVRLSPLNDLPDPSLGKIAGCADLAQQAFRRNYYITISGMIIGRRYYFSMLHGEPASYTDTASIVTPSDGGAYTAFGLDGADSVLAKGIRRYGFTATGTSISFLREGGSLVGAYLLGFTVTDEGV